MSGPPSFVIASGLVPHQQDWQAALDEAESVAAPVGRILGFTPRVRLASLAAHPGDAVPADDLARVLDQEARSGAAEIFVLPADLEWSIWQREAFSRAVAEFRRKNGDVTTHYDDADACHPLVVECLAGAAARQLGANGTLPARAGLLLVASGHGDGGGRAESYRLMRLLWEQLSLGRAEVAFLRHPQPFLHMALERCLNEPLEWTLVVQSQWRTEQFEYAATILDNFQRAHPESTGWMLAAPPGDHPLVREWLAQRMIRLWQEKRNRETQREPSRKSAAPDCAPRYWSGAEWSERPASPGAFVARASNRDALAAVLAETVPASETYLVKVTWHGYAPGTFTDAAALDLLLAALPGRAVILEGHSVSRNLGGANFDWEIEAREHRAWIKQQEAEFLRRTGLDDVLARHGAQYLNVTEAYWDGACARPVEGASLHRPELAPFIPEALLALRGAPFISFARFKGPTRLGISNLFGLIPAPLRTAWHGTGIADFAGVCCSLAKLYGELFPMFGVVEALHSAVRWNRKGLYRSRWGNYDLTLSDGIVTVSHGLAGADILASRLQGQDVRRSTFFDVVRRELEWPEFAVEQKLPLEVQTRFA